MKKEYLKLLGCTAFWKNDLLYISETRMKIWKDGSLQGDREEQICRVVNFDKEYVYCDFPGAMQIFQWPIKYIKIIK